MSSKKLPVVVIGGSFAGITLAQSLLKTLPNVHIDLINPSSHLYFNLGAARILAKPKSRPLDDVFVPIQKAFATFPKDSFRFVEGVASHIDINAKTVQVNPTSAGGQPLQLSYDYLIIASGSATTASAETGPGYVPIKNASYSYSEFKDRIGKAQDAIASAREIVVAGGGPVGIEVVSEIAEAYPDKTVHLISLTKTLLPTLKDSAGKAAENGLKKLNVKLALGRSVTSSSYDAATKKWTISLDDGKTLHPDLYISAFGVVPNNSFIPPSLLTSDGWVKVDDYFHVLNSDGSVQPNIYAVGDITHRVPRLAMKVSEQVPAAAINIKADILKDGKNKAYKPGTTVLMAVPVGGKGGTGQIGSFTMPSFLVAFLKAKDYLISRAPSFVGVK